MKRIIEGQREERERGQRDGGGELTFLLPQLNTTSLLLFFLLSDVTAASPFSYLLPCPTLLPSFPPSLPTSLSLSLPPAQPACHPLLSPRFNPHPLLALTCSLSLFLSISPSLSPTPPLAQPFIHSVATRHHIASDPRRSLPPFSSSISFHFRGYVRIFLNLIWN